MSLIRLITLSGAFATPLPWQAEISFLMVATLLLYTPHIIDSIGKYRESDHNHDHDHDKKEDKQRPD